MLKFLVTALCVYLASVAASGQSARTNKQKDIQDNKISPFRYIAGGVVGTTIGFGTGHAIQGRWRSDYGWVFTVASIVAGFQAAFRGDNCGVPGGDTVDKRPVMHVWENPNYDECVARNKRLRKPWANAFLITKGIETISVWWPRNVSFSSTRNRTQLSDSNLIDIREEDYVLGGVLGTFVGFGLGHAVQGRWQHKGKYYTYTQLAGLGLTVLGSSCQGSSDYGEGICHDPEWMLLLGIPLFLISRIVEIFSVWGPDTSHYRVVSARPQLPFSIMPLLNTKQAGLQLTVSL